MCMQCPKISFLIQRWRGPKDGEFFFPVSKVCTLSHDLPFDVEVDGFFKFSNVIAKCYRIFLCSKLKDDLRKMNLVLNSFSVGPVYVSWLFEVVSVTVALYTTHLVRHLPSSGQEFFTDSYIICYDELILSFCAVAVSDCYHWRLSIQIYNLK